MLDGKLKRMMLIAAYSVVAVSLPLSEWLLSVSIFFLLFTWILNDGLRQFHSISTRQKGALIFLGTWFVYVFWLLNTSDSGYGLKMIRLKLPMIVFPVVAAFSSPLSLKELKTICSFFIAGVVISSAAGTITGYGKFLPGISDTRELSLFISHIRLAVMSVFALMCCIWFYFISENKKGIDLLFPITGLWLVFYIYIMVSVTGIFLLAVTALVLAILILVKVRSMITRILTVILLTGAIAAAGLVITNEISEFYDPEISLDYPLAHTTLSGNFYWHDTLKKDIENGNRVWVYICEPELKNEWERRSALPYDSADRKGQELRITLIRYLTSAAFKKDSAGLSLLTDTDIKNIESGMTNSSFAWWPGWRTRIYEIIWQIDYYRKGGNPEGHSITQRYEFMRAGWHAFLRSPLFGAGTGDIISEMREQYQTDKSRLKSDKVYLPHNQYLSFLVSFGITGFLIIIFSIFYPVLKSGRQKEFLPLLFLLIIFISMLWEDALETHTGVSFFAFFYSLLILAIRRDETKV